ncbi:lipid transporter atnI like protein [Verticillium longisporum]|nr:lipid transporter atnI like protein [Verticillium longisporum]
MSGSATATYMPSATSAAAEPSCTTAVPGKHGKVPYDACNSNSNFEPDFAVNCAFAVLFGLTLGAHLVQAVTWKKRFCWVVTMAAAGMHRIYAILGQLFFLLAPLWMNAFVYMTVSRLVYYILPDRSIWNLKATQLTKLFVWIDVLCFLVQAGGGSLLSGDDMEMMRIGQYIYAAGCAAQLFFIVIFCALMGRLYVRMREAQRFDLRMTLVKSLLWALLAVLILIIIRIVFRLYEFKPGSDFHSEVLTNEYYALGLDALPMLLGLLLLNAVHPGWVLRGLDSELPRVPRREKKEIKRLKKEAKKAAKLKAKEEKRQKKAMKLSHVKEAQRSSDTFEMNEASERGDAHAV